MEYDGEDLQTRVSGITINDAIYWSAEEWDSVQKFTLNRVRAKLLDFNFESDEESITNVEPNLTKEI